MVAETSFLSPDGGTDYGSWSGYDEPETEPWEPVAEPWVDPGLGVQQYSEPAGPAGGNPTDEYGNYFNGETWISPEGYYYDSAADAWHDPAGGGVFQGGQWSDPGLGIEQYPSAAGPAYEPGYYPEEFAQPDYGYGEPIDSPVERASAGSLGPFFGPELFQWQTQDASPAYTPGGGYRSGLMDSMGPENNAWLEQFRDQPYDPYQDPYLPLDQIRPHFDGPQTVPSYYIENTQRAGAGPSTSAALTEQPDLSRGVQQYNYPAGPAFLPQGADAQLYTDIAQTTENIQAQLQAGNITQEQAAQLWQQAWNEMTGASEAARQDANLQMLSDNGQIGGDIPLREQAIQQGLITGNDFGGFLNVGSNLAEPLLDIYQGMLDIPLASFGNPSNPYVQPQELTLGDRIPYRDELISQLGHIPVIGGVVEPIADFIAPTNLFELGLSALPGIGEIPGALMFLDDAARTAVSLGARNIDEAIPLMRQLLVDERGVVNPEDMANAFTRARSDEVYSYNYHKALDEGLPVEDAHARARYAAAQEKQGGLTLGEPNPAATARGLPGPEPVASPFIDDETKFLEGYGTTSPTPTSPLDAPLQNQIPTTEATPESFSDFGNRFDELTGRNPLGSSLGPEGPEQFATSPRGMPQPDELLNQPLRGPTPFAETLERWAQNDPAAARTLETLRAGEAPDPAAAAARQALGGGGEIPPGSGWRSSFDDAGGGGPRGPGYGDIPGQSGGPGDFGPDVSFMQRPPEAPIDKVAAYLDQWELNNRVLLDSIQPKSLAFQTLNVIENIARGGYSDSYFNALLRRQDNLEQGLSRYGLKGEELRRTVDTATQAELAQRYGDAKAAEVYKQIKDREKELSKIADSFSMVLRDRLMNMMFGMVDVGIFGQQMLGSARNGLIPAVVGMTNRLADVSHLPHVNLYAAQDAKLLGKRALAINDGLYQGIKGSALDPSRGSPLRYVPGLDVIDKYAITPVVNAVTQLQYGHGLGTMRQMIYEGNLALASFSGQDITNPAVRAAIAKNANNITYAAETALTPGRSAVERVATISPAMFRSRIEQVLDMTKLVSGNDVERQLAAVMIASNAAFILGAGKVINDQFGITDWISDPTQFGFGTVTLADRDDSGRHIQVSLFPQASFERALIRSGEALKNADWDALGEAWARFAAGQEGLLLRPWTNAAGIGYDTQGKFHMGDMNWKEGLKASLPIPPVIRRSGTGNEGIDKLIGAGSEGNPLRLGLEALGLPVYNETVFGEKLRTLATIADPKALEAIGVPKSIAQQIAPEGFLNLASREKEAKEALVDESAKASWAEADRKAHSEYQLALDRQQQIRDGYTPALQILEGKLKDPNSDPYVIYQAIKLAENDMQRQLHEVEFPEGSGREKSQIQQLVSSYYSLFEKATTDGKTNWDVLEAAQKSFIEGVKERSPQLGERLAWNVEPRANPKDPPIVQTYDNLKPLTSQYYDLPETQRAAWRIEHPQVEGLLTAYGIFGTAHTPQAAEVFKSINGYYPDVTIRIQNALEVPNNPNYPGARAINNFLYNQLPEDQRFQWLRDHPWENATLILSGHNSSVYSMEAYNFVQNAR